MQGIIHLLFGGHPPPVLMLDSLDSVLSELEEILPPELSGITADTAALTERVGIRAWISEIASVLRGEAGAVGSFLLTLLVITTLSALLSALGGRAQEMGSVAMGILIAFLSFGRIAELFGEVTKALSSLVTFFGGLIPIIYTVTLSGGGVAASSVQATGMGITLSVIGGGFITALSAASGLGLAASVLSVFGDHSLHFSRGLRSLFGWLLGISTTLLLGTLSLQRVIASAADSAAIRAGRYALSGMIPVVGGTVSGALSTLASGLSYVKGVVGVSSVLAIVTVAVAPLLSLLLYRLALSLSGSYAELLGARTAASTFTSLRAVLDTVIATYALAAVIMLLEIILFVKGEVAIG